MKGSIRRQGKGSWRITYELPRGPDGKRQQRYLTVRGKRVDAEIKLRELLGGVDDGTYVEPSQKSLGEYLKEWLALQHPRLKATTYEGYEMIIRVHLVPGVGFIPAQKLTAHEMEQYYQAKRGKGLSEQTLLHHHRLLSKALKDAVRKGLMPRNIMEAVDAPKPRRDPDKHMFVTDPEQTRELLALFDDDTQLRTMVLVAVTTGLRRGELLGLKWDAMDLDAGYLTVKRALQQTIELGLQLVEPKTKASRRKITLPSITTEELRSHRARLAGQKLRAGPAYDDQEFVFAQEDGRPLSPDGFTKAFKLRLKGTPYERMRLHDLRHTHASQLLLQGVHAKVVSQRLGHTNIGITLDTYSHLLPGIDEAAAAKIDEALRK